MQHLDEGTIHSWLDGALSTDEAARVEAHVAECSQCAAAVAEARGFIAASSRILTALDNAPRGVIPVATPVKRVNPLVWRVAATVLVVAAGTLVVVQNRERSEPLKAVSENQATALPQPTEGSMERGSDAATAAATDGAPANATANQPSRSTALTSKRPAVAFSEKAGTGNARRGVTMGDSTAMAGGSVLTGRAAGVSSDYVAVPAPAAPTAPPSRVEAVAARDAAAEPERLKVVSTPRQIGAKVTLYEVAAGDTVTLTEATPVTLNAIVLRGATSMAPQAVGKTAAAAPRERADLTTRAAPESRRTGEVAAAAPTVAARAPAAQVGSAIAIHTITWKDPATGSTLTLSGRMPEARLQEIRIRIERERAAAAAAKKNP
jgi:Putative zinc-finger